MKNLKHSEEYFGFERDYFWNSDYVELLSKRLNLLDVKKIADIGCGVGHWSKSLLPTLAQDVSLTGLDIEGDHLLNYNKNLKKLINETQIVNTIKADACSLPIESNTFDLATCQTLLLHISNPHNALTEMVRITKQNGLILCAEPNNLIGRLPFGSFMNNEPIERTLKINELAWRYIRGRFLLGKGNEAIGEELPGMFNDLDLQEIKVWLCDKALISLPPYNSPEVVANFKANERWKKEDIGPYDRNEFKENVIAAGGTNEFFETAWIAFLERNKEIELACQNNRWSYAGGTLFYIISGRKP